MRVAVLSFLFFACVSFSMAQNNAYTFEQAEKKGLTVSFLDKKYANALDSDSTKAVFSKNSEEFIEAYKLLLGDLGRFLRKQKFILEKPTRVIHRIYFKNSGEIDYYLINLKPSGFTTKQQQQFLEILNKFSKNHKISITADKNFAQCGPAVYQN